MTDAIKSRAWELYEKLPRPLLRWIAAAGALWVMIVCDLAGMPQDSATRGVILAFVATVYGLRGLEKIKGVE